MKAKQIKEAAIFTLILIAIALLLTGMTSLLYQSADIAPFGDSDRNIVTLYDDGSIRVIERAGDIMCFEDGRAVDCINRGLKQR